MQSMTALTTLTTLAAVAFLTIGLSGQASAQGAAPNLTGAYRCEPEPSSCQWSGQTGTRLDMKSDKGDVAQGLLSSNATLSVGALEHARRHSPGPPHPMVERHDLAQAIAGGVLPLLRSI
jgi:hypothetical protein